MNIFYPNRLAPGILRRCLALTVLCCGLWSAVSAQGTCATAIPLTPGIAQSGNTANTGDVYDDNVCLGSYDGGNDYLFSYTATAADDGMGMQLTLTSPATWTGISLQSACPDVATLANCLGSSTSSAGNETIPYAGPLVAGTTYFIHISTFPLPQTAAFTLTTQIVAPPPPPATVGTLATSGCNDMVTLSTQLTASSVRWVEFNYDGGSQTLTFDTEGSTIATGNDTEIGLYNSAGSLLGNDDDGGTGSLSSLTLTNLAAGTYYIVAGGFNTIFGTSGFNATSTSNRTGTLVFNVTASATTNLVCNNTAISLDAEGEATLDLATVTTASQVCDGDDLSADVTAFDCTTTGLQLVNVSLTPAGGTGPQTCQVTVTVSDDSPATIDCSNLVGIQTVVSAPVTCLFVNVGTGLDPAGFSDNCGEVTLTNNINGTATLAGEEFEVGNVTVTFSASDGVNAPATCTFTVLVTAGSPECETDCSMDASPPIIECEDITVELGEDGTAMIENETAITSITDNCDMDPEGPFTMGGPSMRMFDCDDAGTTVSRTVVANDMAGNQGSCTFMVTIEDNIAPVITCTTDTTVSLGANGTIAFDPVSALLTSTDNCSDDDLTVTASDPTTFDCGDIVETFPFTITVTDASDNETTCLVTVAVEDNTPPIFTILSPTVTLNNGGTATLTIEDLLGTVTDNCGIADTTLSRDLVFSCDDIGDSGVDITISDVNGNDTTLTATVFINFVDPSLGCNGNINITLNENCQALIVPSMVLAGNLVCLDQGCSTSWCRTVPPATAASSPVAVSTPT